MQTNWNIHRFLLWRKIKWTTIAVLAPEYILALAIENHTTARRYAHKKFFHDHGWTLTFLQFAESGGFSHSSRIEVIYPTCAELAGMGRNGELRSPPISAAELQSRSKSSPFLKVITIFQVVWFGLQVLFRALDHLHVTALEISVIAFIFCSLLTYLFNWNLPQDIEYAIPLILQDHNASTTNILLTSYSDEEGSVSLDRRSKNVRSWLKDAASPVFYWSLLAICYGALHCLAWNSKFPTGAEKIAWRVCAISTAALGPLIVLVLTWRKFMDRVLGDVSALHFVGWSLDLMAYSVIACYIVSRMTLIVLAFVSLRVLPEDTYQTVAWHDYILHLGT